jgi:hypothetical protein
MATRDGVPGRVDDRVAHALKVLVDSDAAPFRSRDARRLKSQVIDLGHASRGVDNKVGGDLALLVPGASMDDELVAALLDGRHRRAHLHINSEIPRSREKVAHKIGVETLQGSIAAMQDLHLSATVCRNMCELEGDVSATDEDNPARQLIQLQESSTRE